MLVIVKDGELTEKKKQECYKYSRYFKLINRITKLLEELEEADEYLSYADVNNIRKDKVKELEQILDGIEEQIKYAKEKAEADKPIWAGGKLDKVIGE